jgi:hypothetical protein
MIITKLIGGNGNQMFQYSAGLLLSRFRGTELKLDINYLLDKSRRYFRHQNRDYSLGMFNISGGIATDLEISKFTTPRKGNKYLYHLKKSISKEHNVFREIQLKEFNDILKLPADSYIEGYWEDFRYIDQISEELRTEFVFKRKIPDSCMQVLNHIKSSNSVCIIFRRGDFVNHPYLDIVGLDYYKKGIKLLSDQLISPTFFIFSDDINWVKANFRQDNVKFNFVSQDLTGPLAEYYLRLIVSCDHFIIPNSTFAWWGAWLSNSKKKIVVAPAKWHKYQQEERNAILPKEWIVL